MKKAQYECILTTGPRSTEFKAVLKEITNFIRQHKGEIMLAKRLSRKNEYVHDSYYRKSTNAVIRFDTAEESASGLFKEFCRKLNEMAHKNDAKLVDYVVTPK